MSGTYSTEHLYPATFDPVEQDRLFHTVVQRSLSGILIFQEERIVFSNPAFQDIVGRTEDEILRTNPFELVHPDDRSMVRLRAAQRMKGLSPPDDYEFRVLTAEGKTKWVHLLATSIVYRGKPSVLANFLDIDERKRAEDLFHEADRLRTILLDTLPHPAMLIRRDRTILAANRHALNLGARIGGFCGREFGIRVFGSKEEGDNQRKADRPAAAQSVQCAFCRADQALEAMKPLTTRAIEAFSGIWDLFWIPVDKDTYLYYAIDVTEQRRIEQSIRDNEERYRLVTDTMNEGLSIQNE